MLTEGEQTSVEECSINVGDLQAELKAVCEPPVNRRQGDEQGDALKQSVHEAKPAAKTGGGSWSPSFLVTADTVNLLSQMLRSVNAASCFAEETSAGACSDLLNMLSEEGCPGGGQVTSGDNSNDDENVDVKIGPALPASPGRRSADSSDSGQSGVRVASPPLFDQVVDSFQVESPDDCDTQAARVSSLEIIELDGDESDVTSTDSEQPTLDRQSDGAEPQVTPYANDLCVPLLCGPEDGWEYFAEALRGYSEMFK